MGKIIKLAQQMWDQFEQATRDDGSKFWRLMEGAPEWMKDVCRAAHDGGKIMPDDFRYEFITDSLCKITEEDEDTDDDDLDSVGNFEGDIYNSDLASWLGAGGDRWWYVDQALKDPPSDFSSLLQAAQVMEKEEVYSQVLEALREYADTLDDEDESDEDDSDEDTEADEEISS